jgi:outer membrane protein
MKLAIMRTLSLAFVLTSLLYPQQSDTKRLTIEQAVAKARAFPSVEASEEQVNAAAAGIRLARNNYLPNVNAIAQINRATRNNVFGMLMPQSVIAPMSGPVLGVNNSTTVWGSAAGVLVSWEPFDFGRRHALVQAAEATQERAQLTAQRTRFDVETRTAAAFLTLLASEQTVRAAQAAVDRSQVLVRSVKALVDAKLRPGADLSRSDTELDAAQTQLLQAEQAAAVAKASLTEFTGLDRETLDIAPGRMLSGVPNVPATAPEFSNNPAAKEQGGVIEESKARLSVLQHTYRPTFELQATGYGRGSGALTTGATLGGWNGLAPNYFNMGVGFTVNFPVLSFLSIRTQQAQEAALGRSAAATYRQVLAHLHAESDAAQATLKQAYRIAEETPKELADARAGFEQATAQYRAGLTNIVSLAEAQRLLAQAEIDDSLAKLAVWRAWLQTQIVQGDISSFLTEASK